MEYVRLSIALILPWLTGYLWLAALESRFGINNPNICRQVGYGFFLGFALLHGIILAWNSLFSGFIFYPVVSTLIVFCLAGGALYVTARMRSLSDSPSSVYIAKDHTVRLWLFWLFAGWAFLHLVFDAIEILHIPMLPWDAWLSWMYRAKVWFYSGHIFVLDDPADWLQGVGQSAFNAPGNHYPSFVPVIALWIATALGHWSETLVNLPVLISGFALGLAIYGQCKECEIARWQSALAAWLLLSIPLVGTHLSLAGQADVWMLGFTGLGFVALLAGLICKAPWQIGLGFCMAFLGIAVKVEGTVWLLGFVLTALIVFQLRLSLVVLAFIAVLLGICALTGTVFVEIPLLGTLGIVDGRIHIPLLGSYALQSFELWDDYWSNFFESGTWHLLWPLVALVVINLLFMPPGRLRRTLLSFYAVLLFTQLVIFQWTELGQWADDWTAINRLPLHFAPALVFSLVIMSHSLLASGKTIDLKSCWWLPVTSLTITLVGMAAYLWLAHPRVDGEPVTFAAKSMRIVVGGGKVAGQIGIIDEYRNNIAILSSGEVKIETDRFGLLKLVTGGANRNGITFFWRNGDQPEDLHSVKIASKGTRWVNLDDVSNWTGEVSEIGLIFYSDEGRPAEFQQLRLSPHSFLTDFQKQMQDWSETSRWNLQSVNFLPAGSMTSTIHLPTLMAAWILVTFVVALLATRQTRNARIEILSLCALLAWIALDIRWTANRLGQAYSTIEDYPLVTASSLDFGGDNLTHDLVEASRPTIAKSGVRTVITAEDNNMRFETLRAKYQALPTATYVHDGPTDSVPADIGRYVLVLKKRYSQTSNDIAKRYSQLLLDEKGMATKLVWEQQNAFLLEIVPTLPIQQTDN